jgi:glycerophosphoryl diester phosphodiesterase
MDDRKIFDRLLTHRLRGFDKNESTVAGLRQALDRGARHIEFDIRTTRDGKQIVNHDPFVKSTSGGLLSIDRLTLDEIRLQTKGSGIASLEEMLSEVRDSNTGRAARIYIDIKDFGQERAVVEMVESLGLMERVTFVSWIARSVFEVHRLRPHASLCFSHWTFFRYPLLYRPVKWLWQYGLRWLVGSMAIWRRSETCRRLASLSLLFDADCEPQCETPDQAGIGRNVGHLLPGVVQGRMAQILGQTGGMVCIPLWCADRELVNRLHAVNVKVAVYSVTSKRQTETIVTRADPDIIFCDDASQFVA